MGWNIQGLEVETIAIIGNGKMGHGIAQVFAASGKPVVMIGRNHKSLSRALDKTQESLNDFASHGLVDNHDIPAIIGRITTSVNLNDASKAQLVIEAVTEDLSLKLDIFAELDQICDPPAVLASSSGQPASTLAEKVRHPERVIATHFWYPPQLIPLVEVCAGPKTLPEVTQWVVEQLRAAGKRPVVIDREIPGFIGNRLQFAMLREAWALWASGAASAEAIDTVVKMSFGRRLGITGPIESADVGGLHTMYHFGASLMPHLDTSPLPAHAVRELVESGANGLANDFGVYDWKKRDGDNILENRTEELFRWLAADNVSEIT